MARVADVSRRWSLPLLAFSTILLVQGGAKIAEAQPPGLDGPYTFGGDDSVQPVKVSPSGTGQPVLFGLLRARWAPTTGDFAFFQPSIDAAFDRMNTFWDEATFGRANFTKIYLSNSIIPLPNSNDFYYHGFQQRDIRGAGVDANVNFPSDKTLVIKSDGQDISITFAAGNWNRANIKPEVDAAITNANPSKPAPTFAFDLAGDGFRIRTTRSGEVQATLEVAGDALPHLGFGAPALFDLGNDAPPKIVFGRSIADTVNFPAAQQLTITTQGIPATVDFTAGGVALGDVVAAIQTAFPGEAQQQPFTIEKVDDPLDGGRGFLVFKSNVDASGDHGFRLTVGGPAATTLGFSGAGVLLRYEPETLLGHLAILHGFEAHAKTLPAGTDLDVVFGNARMFVGVLVDNNNFRAHHSSWSFNIEGQIFDVNYFASRQNYGPLGEVFAHETGHALGLPDLYKEDPWQVGNPPGNWDVMDCSVCDAHPVAYLKSRHHREPSDRSGQWIDEPRIARVTPPPAGGTRIDSFILTPVESPWISSNPFAATHPTVPVVHAVEFIPTDERDVFVVENRQVGPYSADHLGTRVDFSTQLPNRGVIVYNGRRTGWTGGIEFLPVNLVIPLNNPLDTVGETFEHVITNLNRIKLSVVEVLTNPDTTAGNPSFSYLIEIRWGEGSFYDVAIREWSPPPWESPDIWVDNAVENDWDVYTYHDTSGAPVLNGDNVAVNEINRLYARIHNLGDTPITQPITVIWRIAIPQVAGGEVETEYGRVTIPGGIPAKSSVRTPPLEWRPTSDNDQHVCWRAEILSVPGELNATLNNRAQENITQWFSGSSSPFTPVKVAIVTKNPFADRSADVRLYVPNVPPGWTVTVERVQFRLPPGGSLSQTAVIMPHLEYFQSRLRDQAGIIASFAAHIEAQTPIRDQWVPFGGVTAIVHPVNENSRITLQARPRGPEGNVVTMVGALASRGPLMPTLGGREINVRFDDGGVPVWIQTLSNSLGEFIANVPVQFRGRTTKVQAFHSGGLGFNRARSNPLTVRVP